ncbi:MAG: hypothetical protein U0441_26410 [Polyangiaceae bacterium]
MSLRSSALASIGACLFLVACGGSGGSSGSSSGGGGSTGGGGSGTTTSSTTTTPTGGGGSGGTTTSGGGGSGAGGSGANGGGGQMMNVCGDGVAADAEECDGADLKGADCTLFGYSKKAGVTCTPDCTFDKTGCKATCDGVLLEPGEECDGANLGNHDCTELGFSAKAGAKCNATCDGIEIGNCMPTCDGVLLEPGEACDGADLGTFNCMDFGYDIPAGLTCDATCNFDENGCTPTCDGANLEPGEECDGINLGGVTCSDLGYVIPAGLKCGAMCTFDTSACAAVCGNGVKEPGEECDTSAPAGQACTGLCKLKFTTVINEIWYDPPGTDSTSASCFIEIKGDPGLDLATYSLKFTRATDGAEYTPALKLDGSVIGANGHFVVVQTAAQLAALPMGATGVTSGKSDMQNGPNNLLLLKDTTVVDAIGYGTFNANFQGEGTPAIDPTNATQTVCRLPEGNDTNNNATDFQLCTPTPGAANMP